MFLKELLQESRDVLDDDAITEIIKTCNVIKNEKVQAQKRKSKGQAQKSKKVDKAAEVKANQLQAEVFDPANQVGKWQSIVGSQLSQAARLNMQSAAYHIPLPDFGKTFVVDWLGRPLATEINQQLLIRAELKYVEPSAPEAELKKIF